MDAKTHSQVVAASQLRKRRFVFMYKAERGCIDCGNKNPLVLELDHREPDDKTYNMKGHKEHRFETRWHSLGWDRLKQELEKCDVRCANCHRIRTAESWSQVHDWLGEV